MPDVSKNYPLQIYIENILTDVLQRLPKNYIIPQYVNWKIWVERPASFENQTLKIEIRNILGKTPQIHKNEESSSPRMFRTYPLNNTNQSYAAQKYGAKFNKLPS